MIPKKTDWLSLLLLIIIVFILCFAAWKTTGIGTNILNTLETAEELEPAKDNWYKEDPLTEIGYSSPTDVRMEYSAPGPIFNEDEWISFHLNVRVPPDIDHPLSVIFYIYDENGDEARIMVDYGDDFIYEFYNYPITLQNKKYINYTSGLERCVWDGNISIYFHNSGMHQFKIMTYQQSTNPNSTMWVNNTLDIRTNLEENQLISINEQRKTNDLLIAIGLIGLLIALWGVLLSVSKYLIGDKEILHKSRICLNYLKDKGWKKE